MTVPRISVVVPFYNNEDLLGDCLQSIAAQTFTDLEVIMVDDGSSDGSAAVARKQADADPRFRLVQVPHGGSPGYTRNRGVEQARGEFLAFVDADDMLPPHAYEKMLDTLEASGSDFVSGQVDRTGPMGVKPSALHARALKGTRIGTHISKTPQLFYDVSVWNKLFRRSFWDANHLTYPEGMLWEDLQIITRAHVLAKAVDVIPDRIYYWRERGKGALSITQSRTDITNIRDRITALLAIDAFLRERGTPKLLRGHQRKALTNDLWLYVCDLSRTSEAYRAEFMELGNSYLSQVSRRVLASLPATHKLAYYLVRTSRLTQLVEFNGWQAEQPGRTLPVLRRHGRLRADLPFREDRELKIPARIYRPHWRELDPFVRIDGLGWQQDRLVISGAAFVPSIDVTKRRNTSKIVVLRPRSPRRPPIVIPARSFQHPDATAWSMQDRYTYDWAGLRCSVSSRWFRVGGRWLTGDWDCFVLVRGHGVWRVARLHTPIRGAAERPEFRQVAPRVRFGARWVGRQLHVAVVRTPAILLDCQAAGRKFLIEVDADLAGADAGAELILARPKGAAIQAFAATARPGSGGTVRLSAEIPFAALDRDAADAELDLQVRVRGGQRARVAFPAGRAEFKFPDGQHEYAVERTRYGNVILAHRGLRPVIDEYSWARDGRLTLGGRYLAPADQAQEAVLRRQTSTDQHVLALQRDGERFTISIPAAQMPSFGRLLPLRDGAWDLLVRPAGDRTVPPVASVYDHARLAGVTDEKVTLGQKTYRFSTAGYDEPLLTVMPALKLTEQGRVQRRMLRGVYYPLQQKLPVRDSIVFVSWKGKQCGDNPRAIADELRRRGDDREHIWAVTDTSAAAPEGARLVLTGTEDYFEALGRSRYVIANDDMQSSYRKRDGQIYVQTWHGTPLKRIGFDIEQPQFISGVSYFDQLADDVAKWDLLLSPNPFSTPIMRRAFRYDGEIYESGYPRNDVLRSGDAGLVAAAVRRRLGLPDGKRVVLYAPTWRDNQYYASGRYRFDFRLDLERAWQELGDDYVILVRGHHHMADDVPAGPRPGFAINVTGYPDISELFLVSDVLITDYSSVMFDFAPTGRPILFFTYDLEQYRDNLRGFYFDFEATAPGPLLATSDEVLAAVKDADTVAAAYRDRYAAFAAKFCPLDDGKAGARACDKIFGH
jgi:CDP-glycerol glycerophosphotransferase